VKNGQHVAEFEKEFASYVGAKYCVALCNGTATLHTALVALGVSPGDRVAVPPLTMSATTIAVLHAGAVPVFVDVDPKTWLMDSESVPEGVLFYMPVSLYGLESGWGGCVVDDAAQTLKKHNGEGAGMAAFTSYSFQASKILALGEGGALVTDDEELATKAREFSSLGYRMKANQPRIDPATLKSPDYARHYSLGWNYRMSDLVAERALYDADYGHRIDFAAKCDELKQVRQDCAAMYAEAIEGCEWLTPQHVPEGFTHDYWAYTVKIERRSGMVPHLEWAQLAEAIEKHGGERPYAAWRLTYVEPAFAYFGGLACDRCGSTRRNACAGNLCADCNGRFFHRVSCPVAEDLQPRLMQFQTNDIGSARRNAAALRKAIQEIG
jgi:perosamine synthetase